VSVQSSTINKQSPNPELYQKKSNTAIVVLIVVILLLIFLGVGSFFILAFLGAKGQPGTIIKPDSVKTPQSLTATGLNGSINLNWTASGSKDVTKYNLYKSTTPSSNFQKIKTLDTTTNLTYIDRDVSKGVTYYYVTTGLAASGT